MAPLPLSTSHRQRRTGLPRLPVINMFWDAAVGAMFSRPALVAHETKGAGPNRGMFFLSGLFNDDRFYISGAQVWRESEIIGTLPGSGRARFAAGLDGAVACLIFCVDGLVYRYVTGEDIAVVTIPDDRLIYDVANLGGRYIYFSADGRFYWSAISDPTTISGSNFATAEAKPDGFVRTVTLKDRMLIFGFETIETWYVTQSAVQPYAPSPPSRIDVGALSGDGVLEVDGRVYFVSNKRQVMYLDGELSQIGDDSVLEAINEGPMTDISLAVVYIDGREFLMLTDRDAATYTYDGANWYRWRRHKKVSMNVAGTLIKAGVTYSGDMTTGDIFALTNSVFHDADGYMERVASAYLPVSGGALKNTSVALQAARGVGNLVVTDPMVEMRYSDVGGYKFSEWSARSLGRMGEFFTKPVWRSLGLIRSFGRVYEFRCSDNVEFAPQAVVVNETRQ